MGILQETDLISLIFLHGGSFITLGGAVVHFAGCKFQRTFVTPIGAVLPPVAEFARQDAPEIITTFDVVSSAVEGPAHGLIFILA